MNKGKKLEKNEKLPVNSLKISPNRSMPCHHHGGLVDQHQLPGPIGSSIYQRTSVPRRRDRRVRRLGGSSLGNRRGSQEGADVLGLWTAYRPGHPIWRIDRVPSRDGSTIKLRLAADRSPSLHTWWRDSYHLLAPGARHGQAFRPGLGPTPGFNTWP